MVATTSPGGAQTVSASTNEVFGVVFEANPTTGYSWSITTQPDPAVAVALDSQMLAPSSSLLGAPGRECFRFQATGAGQTNVGFAYARPFEPDAPPAQTAQVQVTVAAPAPSVPVQLPAR
jgi:predicted secreted protein